LTKQAVVIKFSDIMVSRSLVSSFNWNSGALLNGAKARASAAGKQILQIMRPAVVVGVGYYLGTRIGFALTPSGQPHSVFWPPNAILLAALLLTPRRVWWALLLAVLPAHMFAQQEVGVPVWTATAWYLTNTSEALIGAFCITRFSQPRKLFESVRGVFIFVIFGVLIAPFTTSFLDAAGVVLTGWGRGYLPMGAERFWTNALAELTIVPIILLAVSNGASWIQKASVGRYCEASLLGLSAILVTVLVFGLQPVSAAKTPAMFYVPLLLLIWATARFGSGGLSLCMLAVALTGIWYVMHGREPFPSATLRQNALSLQILLCTIALPLIFLAAYMTEAQRSRESLRKMAGNLIEAQEQERARIGRELHDDVNQRLAMLAVELEELKDNPTENRKHIQELRKELAEISNDIQALSHELHSSKLEYLGVVAGIKSWCKEFAERQKVEVAFDSDVQSALQPEIGLTLFRVLQEALHNAIKHSGLKSIEVQLSERSSEVHLIIVDKGVGFNIDAALQGHGLGLTSMQERARLVNGTILIESKPMSGTTIHVRVPLTSQNGAQRATG
jgi:signal transduction histidine kinase